jgi:hypothetical protein
MDSTQRKFVFLALSAAGVFVWASYALQHFGEVHWTLRIADGQYGIGQVKTSTFLLLGQFGTQDGIRMPSLFAAALVSIAFISAILLLVFGFRWLRRFGSRYESHMG